MKIEDLCWLENWQVRYAHPEEEYGSRRGEIAGTFLAIKERKNCVLAPEYRDKVALVGNVFNFPGGEFEDDDMIMTSGITRIEHRKHTEEVNKLIRFVSKIFRIMKIDISKISLDKKEKEFATIITINNGTSDGMEIMLGHIGQRLETSANDLNWDIMLGASGCRPEDHDDEKHFEDYAEFFTEVNECYKPLELE